MMSRPLHIFRIIDGCPCPSLIAPYIKIVLDEAHATANSIYRGDDARALLNKYGHMSQTQLYELFLAGKGNPANAPGTSTHELKSDGVAYPSVPRGHNLPWWGIGVDVDVSEIAACQRIAKKHGWELFRPYLVGSELHHVNFKHEPKPHSLKMRLRIIRLRATLPRK